MPSRAPSTIRRAVDGERRRLAEFAARLQLRRDRHVVYLADDADTIAAELIAEDHDWTAVSAVAEVRGSLVGWLMGSVDVGMGRVWWFGPFVAPEAPFADVADLLYVHVTSLLPEQVTEEEMAIDAAFVLAATWGAHQGFVAEEGSLSLHLAGPLDSVGPPRLSVRPATPDDASSVAPLHDVLFPGTHLAGDRLIAGAESSRPRLVLERDGELAGYVAVERHPDGSGYIDYLGVAPRHRGRGYGRELVRAGVAVLLELGCDRVHLTVREGNLAARRLYAQLGFVEDRVLVPLRKGFALG